MGIRFEQPTIFHITHQKAGSQWVREILKYSAPERFVSQELYNQQLTKKAIQVGKIYAAVYMSRGQFLSILHPFSTHHSWKTFFKAPGICLQNWHHFGKQKNPVHCFTVIRDLRDTLISLYFSERYSHPLLDQKSVERRKYLTNASFEEGLYYLMHTKLSDLAVIQASWITDPGLLIRYEDLLKDADTGFRQIIQHCEIHALSEELGWIIKNNLFEKVTGRARGIEDVNSHLRKGITGDWKNHFSNRIKDEFKTMYGAVLIETGYETDFNW